MNYDQALKKFEGLSHQLVNFFSKKSNVVQLKNIIAYTAALYYVTKKLYVAFFGPLSRVPGPFITRFMKIPRIVLDTPRGTVFQKLFIFHDRYGDIVRLSPSAIAISNKELIKQAMMLNDLPKGNIYKALQRDGEQTMFSSTDKSWHKNRRRIVSPAFSIKYLGSLEPFMLSCVNTLIRQIDKEIDLTKDGNGYGTVDIWSLLQRLALDVLGETSFGKSFDMVENNNHIIPGAISQAMRHNAIRGMMPILSKLILFNAHNPQPIIKKFLCDIIDERINDKSTERSDILQFLINSQKSKDQNDRLTSAAIVEETVLILLAGSETTSNSIGFVFYELLRNPNKLVKLYEEIDTLDENSQLKHEQLKHLPYLNAVINESLRLNPVSVATLNRVTTETTILDDLVLPKNIDVHINMLHLQTNEKHWPKPYEFIPERWTEEKDSNDLDAYLPFSLGSRNCIGKNFAYQQMRLTLVAILKNFDIQPIASEMEDGKIRRQFITHRIAKDSFSINIKRRSL